MNSEESRLDNGSVERICQKLGLSNRPTLDFAGLKSLYSAWCKSVPFDNSLKLIAVRSGLPDPLPGGDPTEFFNNWLTLGAGGTCWSGNGALYALVASLGFEACRGEATMLVAPDLPPNHGTVLVTIENRRYVVDASILSDEPVPSGEGDSFDTTQSAPAWGVRTHFNSGKLHVWWRPAHLPDGLDCRFDSWGLAHQDYLSRYEGTRGWSPFNYELCIRKLRDDSAIAIAGGKKVVVSSDGTITSIELSEDEKKKFLVEELGLSENLVARIPQDVPTPPPPGSKTSMGIS